MTKLENKLDEMINEIISKESNIFDYKDEETFLEYNCDFQINSNIFITTIENIYSEIGNKRTYMLSSKYCSSVISGSITIANTIFEQFNNVCWFVIFEKVLSVRAVIFTRIVNSYFENNRPQKKYIENFKTQELF